MSGRILIVDDVATNRIVLKVKLANARYEVLQAASAAEALSLARSQLPHLILLDVKLPNSDGVTVLRALRADPGTCRRDGHRRASAPAAGPFGCGRPHLRA